MLLTHLSLQHFRKYTKADFSFGNETLIVGPNTAGKTNILEAMYVLSLGHSFRAERDMTLIQDEEALSRIKGAVENGEETTLEVLITRGQVGQIKTPLKKFLVNGVPKRRVDFAGQLRVILFVPSDLDILLGSPSLRRNVLDSVLEQVSHDYRYSLLQYTKALRQRNALLDRMRETATRSERELQYWNELLITHGQVVSAMREEFIIFFNTAEQTVFRCHITYDHSLISQERLEQYRVQEVAAAVTLVGPHRDDFFVTMERGNKAFDVKQYGSRGQQRLVVLQIKLLQIAFIEHKTGVRPLFLLDDIFSELDSQHIETVLTMIRDQQTVITTTHEEFVPEPILKKLAIIELPKT